MNQNNIFLNTFQKIKNSKIPEIIVFIAFIGLAIFVSCYHEPWFDEIYAWFLASHNSFWALLTEVPPTEGHPPLWHFILKTFTYTGISPDICLKFISICFASAATYLLLFKSPFPRIAKLLLPFTYFLFWHGCIVIRPYCMLMFGIFLNAILFKTKNEHPFRFMFSLWFIALCSAYGIIIGASIAISWLIEIYIKQKQSIKDFIKNFSCDKRFWAIVFVGIFCILTVLNLISWNIESNLIKQNYELIYLRIIYLFSILPVELFYSSMVHNYMQEVATYPVFWIFCSILLGLLILLLLKKIADFCKKTNYLLIPWFLLLCFGSIVYIYARHFQIFIYLLIWFMWICYQDGFSIKNIPNKLIKNLIICMFSIAFIFNIYWTIGITKNDIKYQNYYTYELVNYIKQNNIDKYTVFTPWVVYYIKIIDKKTLKIVHYPIFSHIPTYILPFFDKNFFPAFTFPNGKTINNIRIDEKFNPNEVIKYYSQKPYPDFIIGDNFADCYNAMYHNSYTHRYKAINFFNAKDLYKINAANYNTVMIYIRKDLYEKFKKEHPQAVKSKDEFLDLYF